MSKPVSVLFGLLLLMAVVGAPILHNVIPHSHGHDHSSGENAVWQSMHSALSHEGKKMLLAMVAGIAFFTLIQTATVRVVQPISQLFTFNRRRLLPNAPLQGVLLSRGVIAYRRFG